MVCGRNGTLVLAAAGVLASLVVTAGYRGEGAQAGSDGAQSADRTGELLEALQQQQAALLAQQQALAEQVRRLEAQQEELNELRQRILREEAPRQAAPTARHAIPATLQAANATGGVAAIAPEQAESTRGMGAGGAGTLQIRPPQQVLGRVRGAVVAVQPEELATGSPEPGLPVIRVPEERREASLGREELRQLLLPAPERAIEATAVEPRELPPEEPPPATAAVPPEPPPVLAALPPEPQPVAPVAAADPPEAVQDQGQREAEAQVAALDDRTRRPEVVTEVLAESVLTPAGVLSVEPSLEYVHSSTNRFIFQGAQIVDAVLIGAIEASDADRDILISALTLRYGLTDRLEVDVKIPAVYRDDRINAQLVGQDTELQERSYDGFGLGDVEFGAHYQITGQPPFLIGNVRVKAPTGTGPFDVDRGPDGVETEAPTGSGFWSVEPSITAIYPSEPVVFFGNLGYLINIGKDVDTLIGDSFIGNVDPGDSVSGSLGMGFALNERASMSFGYEHNFIFETETEITDDDVTRTSRSNTLQVGNFFIGGSYRVSDRVTVNSTVQIGVTEDAPDVQFTLRVPIRFDLGQLFRI